jgi:hypothetical protein
MSGLGIAALALTGTWLAVLTLVIILAIRQIGLLTVHLGPGGPALNLATDGLPVGSEVPDRVIASLPMATAGRTYLLLASAGCKPCRNLVEGLRGQRLPSVERVVALVPGHRELAASLLEMLPTGIISIPDPEARELAAALQVQSAPFAIEIVDGKIAGKTYLHGVPDLIKFLSARPEPAVPGIGHGREVPGNVN